MSAIWNLRGWLRERGVTRASEVSRIVRARTGYVLSEQAVYDLLNKQPKMLRVETIQALCDAFYGCLSDFFEVKPRAACRSHIKRPRNSDPLSSQGGAIIEGAKNNAQESPGLPRGTTDVDFAAFFPDARKFSSEQPKTK